MKKIIKLTESDLVRLVKRVIKEDEMGDMDMDKTMGFDTMGSELGPKKKVQDIINSKRFNELQEGMMVSIKSNKLTILPSGSEGDEKYVIDLRPKSHSDVIEQQTKIQAIGGTLVIKFKNGELLQLEPSMKVLVFNP